MVGRKKIILILDFIIMLLALLGGLQLLLIGFLNFDLINFLTASSQVLVISGYVFTGTSVLWVIGKLFFR